MKSSINSPHLGIIGKNIDCTFRWYFRFKLIQILLLPEKFPMKIGCVLSETPCSRDSILPYKHRITYFLMIYLLANSYISRRSYQVLYHYRVSQYKRPAFENIRLPEYQNNDTGSVKLGSVIYPALIGHSFMSK